MSAPTSPARRVQESAPTGRRDGARNGVHGSSIQPWLCLCASQFARDEERPWWKTAWSSNWGEALRAKGSESCGQQARPDPATREDRRRKGYPIVVDVVMFSFCPPLRPFQAGARASELLMASPVCPDAHSHGGRKVKGDPVTGNVTDTAHRERERGNEPKTIAKASIPRLANVCDPGRRVPSSPQIPKLAG